MSKLVCGIDEVGRGALAGPLVVASVIFKDYNKIPYGIIDSKLTSFKKRKSLFKDILYCSYIGVGYVDSKIIDKVGISEATVRAINQSIETNICRKDLILIDGNIKLNSRYNFRSIVKGDSNYVSIAAASIVAKFIRDNVMILKSYDYPNYDWNNNKGYGTKEHLRAINLYGVTDFHRKSYNFKVT